jgi:glucose/mannose transport system permease protein
MLNKKKVSRIFLFLVLGIFVFYYITPLYVMVVTSLKTMNEIREGNLFSLPNSINFESWKIAWTGRGEGTSDVFLKPYFFNSLKIAIPALIISTFLGALNGYALTKWKFKGANLIFLLFLFGTFIPYQAILLPMARTLGLLGISNSPVGLILVHTVYGLGFTTLFFRNYYVSISDEIIKAARVDGAGFFKIFFKILLPVSLPIWNDFLFGVTFSFGENAPLQVALNNMVLTSASVKYYNVDMAAAIMAALPTLIIYVLAGNYFIKGLTAGSVKG